MDTNKNTQVFNFGKIELPQPWESRDKAENVYVRFGKNNLYPNWLLSLYNESPIHSAIVNSKANYIIGNGLKLPGPKNLQLNPVDTTESFLKKVVTDYLLHNAFAIEVIYNLLNQPIEYHVIPVHKVRMNRSKTKFWYCYDWFLEPAKFTKFDRWKPKSADSVSKLFYFEGHSSSPTNHVYSTPDYNGALLSIENDIEIRKFNLNNIKNHFSVSTLITFFMGSNVDENVKAQVLKDIEGSYTGSEGGKVIVDFQAPDGKSPEVKNIAPNDWDKAYTLIHQAVKDDIFIGHQITSPMLFGVKTEGQLGGTTELELSYEVFSNTYIRNKRNELEAAFNLLFSDSSIVKGTVEFEDRPLFSSKISEALKEKVYTINELRKDAGMPPIKDGDRLMSDAAAGSVGAAEKPVIDKETKFSREGVKQLSDEDFEKIKDLGIGSEDFEFVSDGEEVFSKEDVNRIQLRFETSDEIAHYILSNNIASMSLRELRTAIRRDLGINVSTGELQDHLQTINDTGVARIEVTEGEIKVNKSPNSGPDRKVEVMYSYEVREDLGAPKLPTTRPFCKKLVDNNRLYTRKEIQSMSAIFEYDIFQYCGGYYRNPDTGEVTKYCRHFWQAKTVVRKNKK